MAWRRSAWKLFGAALCAAALAGCGGSSDSTESTTVLGGPAAGDGSVATAPEGPLTRAEFNAAADEICAAASDVDQPLEDRLEALGEEEQSRANFGEAAEVIGELVPLAESQLADLRALQPPPADVEKVEQNWYLTEAGLFLLRELAEEMEEFDTSTIAEIRAELKEVGAELDRFERRYGMKVCGSDDLVAGRVLAGQRPHQ